MSVFSPGHLRAAVSAPSGSFVKRSSQRPVGCRVSPEFAISSDSPGAQSSHCHLEITRSMMQYDASETCIDLRSPSRAHASACVRRNIGRLIAERMASPGEALDEEFCSIPSTPLRPRAPLYFPSSVGGPLSEMLPQPRPAKRKSATMAHPVKLRILRSPLVVRA